MVMPLLQPPLLFQQMQSQEQLFACELPPIIIIQMCLPHVQPQVTAKPKTIQLQ